MPTDYLSAIVGGLLGNLGFLLGALGVMLPLSFTLQKRFAFAYLEVSRPTIRALVS